MSIRRVHGNPWRINRITVNRYLMVTTYSVGRGPCFSAASNQHSTQIDIMILVFNKHPVLQALCPPVPILTWKTWRIM